MEFASTEGPPKAIRLGMTNAEKTGTVKHFHKTRLPRRIAFRSSIHYTALAVGIFFNVLSQVNANTIKAASPKLTDVSAAIASAVDGDTVTIPAGTASWTTSVTAPIAKSITIIGQTTVDPVAKTANDQTILLDDMPSTLNSPLISMPVSAGKIVRVSGITFKKGARTSTIDMGVVNMASRDTVTLGQVRLDHCHFIGLYRGHSVFVTGAVKGVIDHNLFDPLAVYSQSVHIRMGNWKGDTNGAGDKSWADYPWFGTDKFIFFEDNCFNNTSGSAINGCIDGEFGGRWVIRHNHMYNTQTQTHGTENRYRGARCTEIYSNDFHFSSPAGGLGGMRTGSHLFHDNTFDGTYGLQKPSFNDVRMYFRFNTDPFGGATGDNPFDINATEANGTHIDGHPPYLFYSGTAATGSNTTTIVDSGSPGWTTNQWRGYVAKLSTGRMSQIQSNTSNTLTVCYVSGGYGSTPTWTAGDYYQIHRPLVTLDQPGRGKCDLITGGWNQPLPVINSVTGTASWPHQALEPCFSWNNLYNRTTPVNFSIMNDPAGATYVEGRDYYSNSSISAAQAVYTAARNGVNYTGPYTYPHPLVTNSTVTAIQPPTNLTIIP